MIAVVLAEHGEATRRLVCAALEQERDIAVVAEAIEPQRIVGAIRKHRPDVLLLGGLAPDFPAPVVVVQHMLDDFLDQFVAWLSTTTRMRIGVAQEGQRLVPGHVYLAPPGAHLEVGGSATAHLVDRPPVAGLRPSADVLFESLSRCRLERRIGVILTGMGSDGAAGLKALRESGGHALAQDTESCAVYGMPRAAVERGAVDEVVVPERLAERLVTLVGRAGDGS